MKPAVREQLLHSQPLRRSDRDRPHQRDGVVKSWGVGEGLVYSSQDTIRAKSPGSVFFGVFLRHDLICSRERCCYSLSNPSHVWLFRHRVCRQLQMGFLFFFFINILRVQGHSPLFACSWPFGSCGENKRQRRQTSPRTATEQTF